MSRPWMPLYVAEYLADTAHFGATEHGAYLLLIMHYWQTGGLPDDDRLLARICRLSPNQWQQVRILIAPLFQKGWKHKRIEFELTEAARISAAGRAGGKASGRARSQRSGNDPPTTVERPLNDGDNDQGNDSATIREALPSLNVCVSSSPTSSSELRETQVERSSGRRQNLKMPLPNDFAPDRELPCSLGWSESAIDQQIERFKDSARAHKRLYADWPAAWRNWVHSPYQKTNEVNGSRKENIRGKWDEADEKLQRFIDGTAGGDVRQEAQGFLPRSGHGKP